MAHVEGILCVHRVYIIMTQSTQHAEKFSDPREMYYLEYASCVLVHYTQIDIMELGEGIVCAPGVYIILTDTLLHVSACSAPR